MLAPDESHIVPGHDPLVMKLYAMPPSTGHDRQIPPQLHLFSRLSKGLSNCGCLVSGSEQN